MRLRTRLPRDDVVTDEEGRVEELEQRLARLVEVLDALPVGVVVRDDDGAEVHRNLRASSPVGDIQVDVLVSRALDKVVEGAQAGGRRHESLELHGPPIRSFELTAEPLASGGVLGVLEDASERRRLDAVRRDFVANVNHELRTPVGALGVLAEALAGETDLEVVHRLVGRMSAEVERARALIEDVLDLTKVESGPRGAPEAVSLCDVVDAALQRVEAVAERNGVPVMAAEAPDLTVEGDRAELVSAVANLLENAVKYSDPGSPVEVEVLGAGTSVEIVVRDRGVGIPAKDLDRVFERFYRVDRARDRRTGGSGLGLAIVRHVAANHGGEVSVTSIEGEGSTFTLRLPGVT
jgi:two-component system sensor histidine kinase SenX3